MSKKYTYLLFCIVVLYSMNTAFATSVYKWRDASGKLHFSDKPPKKQRSETIKIEYDTPPINAKEKKKKFPKVIMYTTTWCPVCKRAIKYFKNKNIPFDNRDIEKSHSAMLEYKSLGGKGVPLIFIGESRMNGFSAKRMNRLLDLN